MTERRATISLGWRPTGMPARRHDDFEEVPAESTPAQPQPERQVEQRGLESRMQNWAKWCTTWGGYPRDRVATAAFCDALEEAALGPKPSTGDRRKIDEDDAKAIERSLWQLTNLQRDILRLHYVWVRPWYSICHIVGIRARQQVFADRLACALVDLATVLDCGQ